MSQPICDPAALCMLRFASRRFALQRNRGPPSDLLSVDFCATIPEFSHIPTNLTPAEHEPPGSVSHWLRKLFKCQICGTTSPPHTESVRMAVATRVKQYPFRLHANQFNRTVKVNGVKRRKRIVVDDPGGSGREIVREITVCPACAGAEGVSSVRPE